MIGIIRDNQNRILLLKHTYRPDPLALPSGFIKKGETPFDALKRELKEETNFEIITQSILNVLSSKTNSHIEFIISAIYKSGEFIPNNEVSSYSWVSESEIQNTIDKLTTNCY
ncbi:MAG: NUDIX hydrolase [Bacteroidota bacterium]